MTEYPNVPPSAPRKGHTLLWVVAVFLTFAAGMLWGRKSDLEAPSAWAQSAPLGGARGVYAFTGQLDRNRFGLFMLDIEQGTVWCYEIDDDDGVRKLKLVAGRSWVYDRYLRDFNCASPSYRQVQDLVALQRSASASIPTDAGAEPASEAKGSEQGSP